MSYSTGGDLQTIHFHTASKNRYSSKSSIIGIYQSILGLFKERGYKDYNQSEKQYFYPALSGIRYCVPDWKTTVDSQQGFLEHSGGIS